MVKGDSFLAQAGLCGEQGGYYSQGLRDFALEYCTKLSFAATAKLIQRSCGGTSLSDQHLWNWVQQEGQAISQQQQETIAAFESSQAKVGLEWVDIYAKEGEEIIYLSDDVCVKEQKPKRDKTLKTKNKRCNTRISMFSLPEQKYHTLVAGFGIDNLALVQACLWEQYPQKIDKLPIVAITDGATSIKNEIKAAFGEGCIHILDWYHLEKKVYETMSMIAYKAEKQHYCQEILQLLWKGKGAEAIGYLQQISPKNKPSQEMLLTYLTKNQASIINYEKRKEVGKTIGSGRGEKQNDIIVAQRQKYNGMAWSPNGSLAMALNTANKIP